jgi:hypothetical protein
MGVGGTPSCREHHRTFLEAQMESPVLQCFLPLGQHIWWQLSKHCRGAAPHHDHNVNELHRTRHTRHARRGVTFDELVVGEPRNVHYLGGRSGRCAMHLVFVLFLFDFN